VSGIAPRVTEAREAALTAALDLVGIERHLHDRSSAAGRLTGAQDAFYLACRDLTNALDDAPPDARPRNWALDPEGRTA
jgi:hypothetical protein